MGNTRIASASLEKFASALLYAGGFKADEFAAIARSLILSESIGYSSHGVMRVQEYLRDLSKGSTISGATLEIIQETPSSLVADAHRGPGQAIMPVLLEKITQKLSTQAVVTAAVRSSGHIGRIGEWVERAAEAGYPGLLLVNDNGAARFVAPPGGKQAVTSTNPLAFAVPLPDGKIFLTDMSTSSTAFGKVKLAHINKTSVPPDCIQDADGNPTTDPYALFSKPPGSLLPMGGAAQGYKGFALSMFLDLLVAGLSGGLTPPAPAGTLYTNCFTLILWNPKFFAGLEHMQNEAQKYIDYVRASPPTDPAKPIRLPGDRIQSSKQQAEREGILLGSGMVENLLKLAKELNVTPPAELVKN